jgi:hypothetical protein
MSSAPTPIIVKTSRYWPEGYQPLTTTLDAIGAAIYSDWSRRDLLSGPYTERSPDDFADRAVKMVLDDVSSRGEYEPDGPSEEQIQQRLYEQYCEETAPRRRRQFAVHACRDLLLKGMLRVIAFGIDGQEHSFIPMHIWRAPGADELFDNGGTVRARGDEIVFVNGLTHGDEGTATILVNDQDIESAANQLRSTGAVTVRPPPYPDQSTGPGRKPGQAKAAAEIVEIARQVWSDVPAGRGRLTAVARVVQQKLREAGRTYEVDTVRRYISEAVKEWEQRRT